MTQPEMSRTQRFITRLVGAETAAAMEAQSRAWLVTCPGCGHQRSVWDLGGIRYKGTNDTQRTRLRCPACGEAGWHRLVKAANFPSTNAPSGGLVRAIAVVTLGMILVITAIVFLTLWVAGVI